MFDKFVLNDLEGMKYNRSPAERDYSRYALGMMVIFFCLMFAHQILRLIRFKNNGWVHLMIDTPNIPDSIRIILNVFERELAPSLFVCCFLFTSGGFMLGSLLVSIFIVLNGLFLFFSYKL